LYTTFFGVPLANGKLDAADKFAIDRALGANHGAPANGRLAPRLVVHQPALNELLRLLATDASTLSDEGAEVARGIRRVCDALDQRVAPKKQTYIHG
jgi:hypothetical protein